MTSNQREKYACPILNTNSHGNAPKEIAVRFDESTGDPISVMCDNYDTSTQKCSLRKPEDESQSCTYRAWKSLQLPGTVD